MGDMLSLEHGMRSERMGEPFTILYYLLLLGINSQE
jgi:hypothetical protein